ncbi:MAG: hypothetical protein II595_07460 [Desulfovibrio sp.]|nr:hypothetical protein [Desulfovibrio sp.]MBQ1539224.1 hypothetical protein [Desulfovibrio sp.]MBQ4125773.1 hypothetical protein [Desulfovibrio sp.]
MPNFDTFVQNLHNYVKRTEDASSKKYRFQESFRDCVKPDKAFDDMQETFFAEQRRPPAGHQHSGMSQAKADPA